MEKGWISSICYKLFCFYTEFLSIQFYLFSIIYIFTAVNVNIIILIKVCYYN